MKKPLFLFFALLMSIDSCAQIQQGYVKTKGCLNANGSVTSGQRLTGATITIMNGNNVVSGANGVFVMKLNSAKFVLKSVRKNNYVLSDPDFLKKQFDCSTNDFIIVMEDELEKANERRRIEKQVRNNLYAQTEKQRNRINQLKEKNKITEEKYRELLQKVNKDEDDNEIIIKDMVEKYSKIDFDQEDEFNRKFSMFLLNGEIPRADSLLRTKGNIKEDLNSFMAFQTANAQKRNEQAIRDSLENYSKKELADRCYKYFELFKNQHKNDSAAFYIETRTKLDSTNSSWLLEAGLFLQDYLCLYDEAKSYFQKAIHNKVKLPDNFESLSLQEQFKIFLGGNQPIVADCWNNIGLAWMELGDVNHALACYKLALQIRKNIYGEYHPDVALAYNQIATAVKDSGDYNSAAKIYQDALATLEKSDIYDAELLCTIFNNIGSLYIGKPRPELEKGLNYLNNALKILESNNSGISKWKLGATYYNLAMAYIDADDMNEAEKLLNKSLEITKKELGENHKNMMKIYNVLGSLYSKQDKNKALSYYEKSLKICLQLFGEGSKHLVAIYNNLGSLEVDYKYYSKGIEYLQKAEKAIPTSHPYITIVYSNIAHSYKEAGDFQMSIEYYRKLTDSYFNVYKDQPEELFYSAAKIANALIEMGALYVKTGKKEEARKAYEKALSVVTIRYKEDDPNISKVKALLDELKK